MASPERATTLGALAIGVALLAAAVFAIRAGGGLAVLGWVLLLIAILGFVGAIGSSIRRK
jgi:hypothetical protein